MANIKKIGFSFVQMATGCCAGILAGMLALFLVNFLWRGLQEVHLNGFIIALLLLISFLVVFGVAVVAIAEGVRQIGRLLVPKETSRRRIYEWSFLGICAAVAVLTATRADWITTLQEWGNPVRLLGTLVYYVIVRPVYFAIFWIPPLFLLIVAGPVGAVLAYNLPPEEEAREDEDTEQNPARSKRGEKK
jgi:hypothetical protein